MAILFVSEKREFSKQHFRDFSSIAKSKESICLRKRITPVLHARSLSAEGADVVTLD
jgi:hypothetical protein